MDRAQQSIDLPINIAKKKVGVVRQRNLPILQFNNFTIYNFIGNAPTNRQMSAIFNGFIKKSLQSGVEAPLTPPATNPSSYTICIYSETTITTSINGRYKCFPFVSMRRVLLSHFSQFSRLSSPPHVSPAK